MWKSLKEEWPYTNDDIWLKWTTDGVTWQEKIVHEKDIDCIDCVGIPEWRELDPPEWLSEVQREQFDELRQKGISWNHRVSQIDREESDEKNQV